jgi:hypothetical protein
MAQRDSKQFLIVQEDSFTVDPYTVFHFDTIEMERTSRDSYLSDRVPTQTLLSSTEFNRATSPDYGKIQDSEERTFSAHSTPCSAGHELNGFPRCGDKTKKHPRKQNNILHSIETAVYCYNTNLRAMLDKLDNLEEILNKLGKTQEGKIKKRKI